MKPSQVHAAIVNLIPSTTLFLYIVAHSEEDVAGTAALASGPAGSAACAQQTMDKPYQVTW
jgi:hypothetical protein